MRYECIHGLCRYSALGRAINNSRLATGELPRPRSDIPAAVRHTLRGIPHMCTATVFADRAAAGRALADELAKKQLVDPVVLALPRGGVAVAVEVARALHAPLDVVLVRKI